MILVSKSDRVGLAHSIVALKRQTRATDNNRRN